MRSEAESLFSMIRRFLEVWLPLQRGASPATVRSYRTALRQFVGHLADGCGGRLDHVSFSSVTECRTAHSQMRFRPSTAN